MIRVGGKTRLPHTACATACAVGMATASRPAKMARAICLDMHNPMKLKEARKRAGENSILVVLREGRRAGAIGTGKGDIRRFSVAPNGRPDDDNLR